MKNTQLNLRPIKIEKQYGTTYCFRCKDYTKHFRPEIKKEQKNLFKLGIQILFIKMNLIKVAFGMILLTENLKI